MKKKKIIAFSLAMVLILSLFVGPASAAGSVSRASTTLNFYNATIAAGKNSGEVDITFEVKAKKIADTVGVSAIKIYKQGGAYVTTITGTVNNGLLIKDDLTHEETYTYKGTSGTSYYAIVSFYAKIGTNADTKTYTTGIAKAP